MSAIKAKADDADKLSEVPPSANTLPASTNTLPPSDTLPPFKFPFRSLAINVDEDEEEGVRRGILALLLLLLLLLLSLFSLLLLLLWLLPLLL